MKLDLSAFAGKYALAPELLLTPTGIKTRQVLAIENGIISSTGDHDEFAAANPDWPITELPERAIIPGFIDTHTHLGQTFGKSAIAGEPSQIWRRIWVPLENCLDDEKTYVAAAWMMLEAIRGGFTTVVNFTRNSLELNEAVHRAASMTGLRLVSSCAASTGSGPLPAILETIERHIDQCRSQKNLHPSM